MARTTDFNIPPVDSGVVLGKINETSVFARATGATDTIPGSGVVVHTWTNGTFSTVAEGGLKPYSEGTGSSIEIQTVKIANVQTISDELLEDAPVLARSIYEQAPVGLSRAVDAEILGGSSVNVDHLDGLGYTQVATPADVAAVFGAVADEGQDVEAIVMSTKLFYKLLGMTNALGANVFPSLSAAEPTLNGVPVYVFSSNEEVGIAGPFRSRAFFGYVKGYPKVTLTDGALETGSATISLAQRNLVGVISEVRFGFRVASEAEFQSFGTEAAEETPEVPEG